MNGGKRLQITVSDVCYEVVIEKSQTGYCSHVPALPGCGATGVTGVEILQRTFEAIKLHVEGVKSELAE